MLCPKCNLENPDGALRCDCGYDFQSKKAGKSYLVLDHAQPTSRFDDKMKMVAIVLAAILAIPLFGYLILFLFGGICGGGLLSKLIDKIP